RHTCRTADEVRDFYRQQGAYLALLYVLEATDFDPADVIAAGGHPVLVDLDALFQPRLGGRCPREPAAFTADTISRSILLGGLLPQRARPMPRPEGHNQPTLNGRPVDPLDYAGALREGFCALYRLLLEHREALGSEGGLLGRFASDPLRILARPTSTYAS